MASLNYKERQYSYPSDAASTFNQYWNLKAGIIYLFYSLIVNSLSLLSAQDVRVIRMIILIWKITKNK